MCKRSVGRTILTRIGREQMERNYGKGVDPNLDCCWEEVFVLGMPAKLTPYLKRKPPMTASHAPAVCGVHRVGQKWGPERRV